MVRGVLIAALTLLFAVPATAAQDRVALVIGNGDYSKATPLPRSATDATDMAGAPRASLASC